MQAGTDFNDTTELSTFGFLYGTFPAAPGAFVIATQYNVEVELVRNNILSYKLVYITYFSFNLYALGRYWHGALHFHLCAAYVHLGENDFHHQFESSRLYT